MIIIVQDLNIDNTYPSPPLFVFSFQLGVLLRFDPAEFDKVSYKFFS